MSKHARLTLSVAIVITMLTGPVYADDDSRWNRSSIVGPWEVEMTIREDAADCASSAPVVFGVNPFPALYTFHEGGTLSETGSRSPPSMRSPGHGVWERTGRNRYESRVRFQGFNELGLLSNNMDIRAQYVVSSDGLSFSAVSRLRFSIEGGPTLPFCATMEGVKITL